MVPMVQMRSLVRKKGPALVPPERREHRASHNDPPGTPGDGYGGGRGIIEDDELAQCSQPLAGSMGGK